MRKTCRQRKVGRKNLGFDKGVIQYRGLLYSAQNIVKKEPGRACQNSLATAGTNFTKPGAQNKGDLCTTIYLLHFIRKISDLLDHNEVLEAFSKNSIQSGLGRGSKIHVIKVINPMFKHLNIFSVSVIS